jgi:hypothetical protein
MARVLGVVDEPSKQRPIHLRAMPPLDGLGLLLRIFVTTLYIVMVFDILSLQRLRAWKERRRATADERELTSALGLSR